MYQRKIVKNENEKELHIRKFLNPNLKEFWNGKNCNYMPMKHVRYRVLYGGRASSKSHEFATMLVVLSIQKKMKILCTRAFQNRIQDSVKGLIESKISLMGLDSKFTILNNKIYSATGSEFLFYGLARNTAEIKGLEGIDIAYIEEGQYITKEMFDLLTPTIRKDSSEIWIAFNPLNYYDFIYQEFIVNQRPNSKVRKINYTENPFLSATLTKEIEELKGSDDFEHIYLGMPKNESDNALFKLEWLEACVNAFDKLGMKPNSEIATIGYDVADIGSDTNAICLNVGGQVEKLTEWHGKENELDKSTQITISFFPQTAKQKIVIYDSIGVGAGVGVFLKHAKLQGKIYRFYPFVASAKVTNPNGFYKVLGEATKIKNADYFENRKVQEWVKFADKIKATYNAINGYGKIKERDIVSFSSKINTKNLFQQLLELRVEEDTERKIKMESKKSMKKRGIPSPNLADSLLMSFIKNTPAF